MQSAIQTLYSISIVSLLYVKSYHIIRLLVNFNFAELSESRIRTEDTDWEADFYECLCS